MKVKWHQLKDLALKEFNGITDVPGIYFVRWAKSGKPVCIPRLGGSDDKGILYVGSGKKLRRRVRQLWKSVKGVFSFKGKVTHIHTHTIGKTIVFCKIFELINLNEYEISWEELRTHHDAIGQEWEAIRLYATKYREPPPLNLGVRREYFAIAGIAKAGKSRVAYEPDEFVKSIMR